MSSPSESSTTTQINEASYINAIKDQTVGAIKQVIGNVIGNTNMELEGNAQKVHGQNEYDFAKSANAGVKEPEKFQQAHHPEFTTENQQAIPVVTGQAAPPPSSSSSSSEPSQVSGWKDQAVGSVKETIGSATNNPQMEFEGKSQNIQGKNEAEFAKAKKDGLNEPQHFEHGTKTSENAQGKVVGDNVSSLSALKDRAVGSVKEAFGSATGNVNTELAGKAQQVHGRNESEFAKAQKEGLTEPEHYTHGTKTTEHAEGKIEDQSVSTLGALKDKTLGSMKAMVGSATGNQDMELKGKAQNIHGRNEAEFVKAQKQGLSEPEHFGEGTKDFEHAKGEVVSDEPSKLSGLKDQAVGAVKETFGSATNNQNMELKGKSQKFHGRNEAEFLKAQKEGLTEPEHYTHGTKTTEHAQGEVVSEEPSKISGWKDQAVGSVKEAIGSTTNNQKMEIEGKAQKLQGSYQCANADAENNTINA